MERSISFLLWMTSTILFYHKLRTSVAEDIVQECLIMI